jgi:16S rRNA (cytosine1402-N4)-methyltransferase
MSHIPVLLKEVLEAFAPCKLDYFADGTLGAGGHAGALLKSHAEIKGYLGIDRDASALQLAGEQLSPYREKLHLRHGNFFEIEAHLDAIGWKTVDGILLDVGTSSMQMDRAERGFSIMREGPLDMRMDLRQQLTAAEIVNHFDEAEIRRILWEYGEEKEGRRIAGQLVELLEPLFPRKKRGEIHPLTLTFQALRIAVNGELEALEKVLPAALKRLSKGGRLAVISFHRLEDRIVKQFFQHEASDKVDTAGVGGIFLDKDPTVRLITHKPKMATDEEKQENPRSRSARLRVVEKL